jgi:uncharacterized phage protein (TIGR01671 family)
MREILFRGQSTDSHKWYEGDLYQSRLKSVFHISYYTEYGNRFSVNVIPETVGQYTGLTDKNGKKIFEGDIVKREYTLWHGETKKTRKTQIGVVVYSNRECGFQVEKKCNLRKPWDGDTIEVIGNIHDNHELLKGE